ncbi:MAG: hypothetical protein D3910_18980 [Candidatus Electrothrix sp. ATG2]|nr:hypothetical protein [Candidatus Electrothrix sp. ATG2]
MLALRQVHTNRNHDLLIRLPPEFAAYKEVEIIILPVERSKISNTLSTKEFIKRFAGSIPDFPELEL